MPEMQQLYNIQWCEPLSNFQFTTKPDCANCGQPAKALIYSDEGGIPLCHDCKDYALGNIKVGAVLAAHNLMNSTRIRTPDQLAYTQSILREISRRQLQLYNEEKDTMFPDEADYLRHLACSQLLDNFAHLIHHIAVELIQQESEDEPDANHVSLI